MSHQSQRLQGLALALHFIMPTAVGTICYAILALLVVGSHTVASSINGTAYPAGLNDELLQGYANFVIQPLATITNNEAFNNVLSLGIWAIIGWIVFSILAAIAGAISEWRNTQHDINIPKEGTIIRAPLQQNLLARMLWRFDVSLGILLFTMLILPVAGFALASDLQALAASSPASSLPHFGLAVVLWIALFHCYVIFLRLYVLRTRVFGEILY